MVRVVSSICLMVIFLNSSLHAEERGSEGSENTVEEGFVVNGISIYVEPKTSIVTVVSKAPLRYLSIKNLDTGMFVASFKVRPGKIENAYYVNSNSLNFSDRFQDFRIDTGVNGEDFSLTISDLGTNDQGVVFGLMSKTEISPENFSKILLSKSVSVAEKTSPLPGNSQALYSHMQNNRGSFGAQGTGNQLVDLINNYRAQRGLSPLSYDARLNMNDNANHSRFKNRGMSGVTNWAQGTDPQSVFNMWRNSPGHNRNMLAPNIRRAGIGTSGNATTFLGQ